MKTDTDAPARKLRVDTMEDAEMQIVEAVDIAEARAVRRFKRTGCLATLRDDLKRAGYDEDEQEWHVQRPGQLMRQGFVSC